MSSASSRPALRLAKVGRVARPGAPTEGPPFEWGYRGRGPTELAEAILFDVSRFDPPVAVALCFMTEVVAELLKEEFELPRNTVRRERLGRPCDARLEP